VNVIGPFETKHGLLEMRHIITTYDAEHIGLFAGETVVAYVGIAAPDDELDSYRIGITMVDRGYRGDGIAARLIEWWIETTGNTLMSDVSQTPEARGVWTSLICKSTKLIFFLWEEGKEPKRIHCRSGKPRPDPWTGYHSRIMARMRKR
jgi:GNAT superfamily N-acetyltransferase